MINNERRIFLSIYPDAEIEIVKKSAGRILTVNGFSALNLDDKGINSDLILSSMKRAYLVNKKK
ncbi:MAG: hypothetical protein EOM50_09290 [Erysipelotrichia bacterium]|nr:hypothetical protein [Erysipelotrichia bacterium]